MEKNEGTPNTLEAILLRLEEQAKKQTALLEKVTEHGEAGVSLRTAKPFHDLAARLEKYKPESTDRPLVGIYLDTLKLLEGMRTDLELSRWLDVNSVSTVVQIRKGRRKMPPLMIVKVANRIGIPVRELLAVVEIDAHPKDRDEWIDVIKKGRYPLAMDWDSTSPLAPRKRMSDLAVKGRKRRPRRRVKDEDETS